jgi:thymidylate kinase
MDATGIVATTATAIDAAVEAPVLVLGSLAHDTTHLQLLSRAAEVETIGKHLEAGGYLRWRSTWATFESGAAHGVELLPAEGVSPGRTGEEFFADCRPLPGFRHLVRPAPHVVLVLTAHELLLRRGELGPEDRRRAADAAGSGSGAWEDASTLAARYQLSGALALLRQAVDQPGRWTGAARVLGLARAVAASPPSVRRRVVRSMVPRGPVLVSLSGPDGSGKSTQVDRLAESLNTLGIPTGTAWLPTTKRPTLPTSIRSWAAGWRRPTAEVPHHKADRPRKPRGPVPRHVRFAEHVWITSAAVSNAAKIWTGVWRGRRHEVLVSDRFVLDADVKLTYWYGLTRGADITLERRLFRAITPKVDVAMLLAVAPETNYARRADEWRLESFRHFQRIYAETAKELGAVVVDAERPIPDVARDVAETVWTRLP